jgi:ribosome-associated translation inhibitor RaiA
MTAPVTLTFRHLPRSGALESSARDIGQRLQKLRYRITACHILLEGTGRASEAGEGYQVKIHVSVPGAQIHAESSHADAKTPLHSAYENAKRQLEKLGRRQSTSAVASSRPKSSLEEST